MELIRNFNKSYLKGLIIILVKRLKPYNLKDLLNYY
jgi:hypothetical protein